MCYVFDLTSDQQLLKVKHESVYGMSMSRNGKQFVSAGWDKHIRLWDCESSPQEDAKILPIKEVAVDEVLAAAMGWVGRDMRMYGVLFSPDGKTIATLGMSTLNIWNADLEQIAQIDLMGAVRFNSFAFSHNGRWIAVGHTRGRSMIYDLDLLKWAWVDENHSKTVYNVAFGADDSTLLTGGGNGVVYLMDLNKTIDHVAPGPDDYLCDLGHSEPQIAFRAHQFLAKHPVASINALSTHFERLFYRWANEREPVGEDDGKAEDNKQASEKARTSHRIALLLSQVREPAADDLLKQLIAASPDLKTKKIFFLARQHRKKFLQRVSAAPP